MKFGASQVASPASVFDLKLGGTAIQPLGRYLKSLAILRLVSEQVDPTARGSWVEGTFRLRSSLDANDLVDFFVNRYAPTPLVSPWNNGSGFGPDDATKSKGAFAAVEALANSADNRLAAYRTAIQATRQLCSRQGWFEATKEEQVALARNLLPDDALDWMDSTVVLTSASRSFPPLLGTGGNDGRFDFSANYMQRIATIVGIEGRRGTQASVEDLARHALFETGDTPLDGLAVGQFDPAAAGGPASVPYGEGMSVGNPWDLVLVLEGALLFASGVARRLSASNPAASVPFAVGTTKAGHPTAAAGENARGELWAPLWDRPATLPEIRQLFSEGRMEFGGRQATTGLDVARAVASLGVDRGVIGFVRHVFVERNGLATFAVPIGVQAVEAVDFLAVLAQLDRWAAPLRRAISAPASLSEGLRELDNAQFAAATDNSVAARQRVLVAAARIDRLAQRSAGLRELGRKTRLSARDWIPALDDGSAELALAVSLASLRGQSKDRRSWLADLVAGDGPRAGRLAAIDHRPVVQTIAELATALAVSLPTPVRSSEAVGIDSGPQDGAQAVPVGQAVLCRFATGAVDERRLRTLLGALCLLDWSGYWNPANVGQPDEPGFIPPAVAVLGPLFARRPWTNAYLGHRAVASPTWPRRIAAGQIEQVCEEALRLYRIAGLEPLLANASGIAKREDGPRILAAVTIPLTDRAVAGLLDRTVRRPASLPATAPAPPSAAPSDLSPVQLEKPE